MSKESRDMLEAEFVAANTPDATKAAALIRDIEKALSATERTAAEERAAIVAFLKHMRATRKDFHLAAKAALNLAELAIERGDHLSRRGEEGGK